MPDISAALHPRRPSPLREAAHRLRRAALLAVPLALTALAPAAQAASACRADIKTHCRDVQPGGGRAIACLQAHEAELTPDCRAELPTLANCRPQIEAACGDVQRPRELRSCLKSHADQIDATCQALMKR